MANEPPPKYEQVNVEEDIPPAYEPQPTQTTPPPTYHDSNVQPQQPPPAAVDADQAPVAFEGTHNQVPIAPSNTTTNGGETMPQSNPAPQTHVIVVVQNPQNLNILNLAANMSPSQMLRLKLSDGTQSCCCGRNCRGLSLWYAAHIWLIYFILSNVFGLINCIHNTNELNGESYYEDLSYIGVIIYSISILVNIGCFYGVYKCIATLIVIQIIFAILTTIVIAMLIVDIFIFDIVLLIWSSYVFYKIYLWARFFGAGGIYDPNMLTPLRRPIQNP